MAAAKSPTLTLHNSLEPPLDYIPVNSGANIQSSKIPSGSKPVSSNFPGPGYLHPLCPNGNPPPCDERPTCPNGSPPPCDKNPPPTCPNGKPPPCDKTPEPTCPNGKPPPCSCKPPLIGTPPNCRAPAYLPHIRPIIKQCPR